MQLRAQLPTLNVDAEMGKGSLRCGIRISDGG
jgi:hypothetical protein